MDYKFFQNKDCQFFPCHKMANIDNFNCLFCYCPLYMLGKDCGGNYIYSPGGIKDCSQCILTHTKDVGFDHVQKKMLEVMEIVRNTHLKETGQDDQIIDLTKE